ncbi:MAG TPA: POTRA domain-containing protein, partial [Candidatus Acidoferrales bacterium]|nr:POTRA domain-containing protein [Candidatus Acidoferrales bacterium]
MALTIALVFLFAIASPAATLENPRADASSSARSYLFSASFDYATGKDVIQDRSSANPQAATQQQFVIVRIDFIGNRRVRSDTLRARIFSREGDVYNEETLRRDFQALWNTQFFEDVKLRVEDAPNRADGKIILFEVKERPQIRRIRYDGIHSVSESDILDRFKERKVGLSVESQFDPTK